jgi:hypothetical protein
MSWFTGRGRFDRQGGRLALAARRPRSRDVSSTASATAGPDPGRRSPAPAQPRTSYRMLDRHHACTRIFSRSHGLTAAQRRLSARSFESKRAAGAGPGATRPPPGRGSRAAQLGRRAAHSRGRSRGARRRGIASAPPAPRQPSPERDSRRRNCTRRGWRRSRWTARCRSRRRDTPPAITTRTPMALGTYPDRTST